MTTGKGGAWLFGPTDQKIVDTGPNLQSMPKDRLLTVDSGKKLSKVSSTLRFGIAGGGLIFSMHDLHWTENTHRKEITCIAKPWDDVKPDTRCKDPTDIVRTRYVDCHFVCE